MIIVTSLSILVALEFLYIMYIETFATRSRATQRTFHMTAEQLHRADISMLFKNQGIYNGLIGIGILYAVFISANTKELLLLIMSYIILVALYGSFSSGDKFIFFKQAGLALLTFIGLLCV